MVNDNVSVVRTTTWSPGPGCHGGCGVLAHVRDGKVIKIEGDPDHPWNQGRLCSRCLAMTQYLYHPDRITQPMKRVGKRGENKWQAISWDEAFALIEKEMKKIRKDFGPESMVFIQGTGRDIGGWISLLAYAYGSPNWVFGLSGLACYSPRLMTMWLTYGDYSVADAAQWLPERYDSPKYKVPSCIMVWGQSLPASCPDGFFGHWLVDLMKKGSELIVIDPRCTWLASRAKYWLQVRPGTDGALVLGFLHVLIKEKRYDEAFVTNWTNGPFLVRSEKDRSVLLRESDLQQKGSAENFVAWDKKAKQPAVWNSANARFASDDVTPALEGSYTVTLADGKKVRCRTVWSLLTERVKDYTPEKVEEITWVPADKLAAAARFYAEQKPAALHWGFALDTMTTTTPTTQAISWLWAITGNFDVPGGNVVARYAFDVVTYPYHASGTMLSLPPEAHAKRIGTWKYPAVRDFRAWAHPDMVQEQIFTEDPYPIKGMWIQGSNPVTCTGTDIRKWYNAMKRLDFIVAVDLFMTPSAMLADVVHPAASFLEKESIKSWWIPLQAIKKVVEVGDCKSDVEINFELARRFKRDFPWRNVEEMFDQIMKPSGMTYQELRDRGWVLPPPGHATTPYRRHEKGILRPDGRPGFRTPSGKIELYSSWLERWGLDPLPYYEEPPYSPVSTPDLYKSYPLIMGTGRRSPVFFHSEHKQIPWLREIEPEPIVEIHPKTAKQQGIQQGDWVFVENWLGKVKVKAHLTPIVHPKMVMVDHAWWYPERNGAEPEFYGLWEVNVNQLIPSDHVGKSGHGSPLKNMLCKIYKAGEE